MNEFSVYSSIRALPSTNMIRVSYFKDHGPSEDLDECFIEYKGFRWKFKSAKNLHFFQQEPTKYVSQYGGYWAFGLSNGYEVKPKMDAYLNFQKLCARSVDGRRSGENKNGRPKMASR